MRLLSEQISFLDPVRSVEGNSTTLDASCKELQVTARVVQHRPTLVPIKSFNLECNAYQQGEATVPPVRVVQQTEMQHAI